MPDPDFNAPRLFVDLALQDGGEVTLDKAQANYLCNVLRLAAGDTVLVFNGRDGEFAATITVAHKRIALAIGGQRRRQEPRTGVRWLFAPLKHARLDYMVQKATEMGVGTVEPVITRRTQVSRVNLDRMRANVVEAAEQCGILNPPEVLPEKRLETVLDAWPAGLRLMFCDEAAERTDPLDALRQAGRPGGDSIAVLIGPEGGFDEAERRALLALPDTVRLSLGPRILRADTAAVAALALVQAVIGDWAGR